MRARYHKHLNTGGMIVASLEPDRSRGQEQEAEHIDLRNGIETCICAKGVETDATVGEQKGSARLYLAQNYLKSN